MDIHKIKLIRKVISMTKISEIDLGSSLLSLFILIGYIATAIVVIRITIIGINYVKVNFPKNDRTDESKESETESKGF